MKKTLLSVVASILILFIFTSATIAAIEGAPDILNNQALQSDASESFNIAHKIFGDAWEIATTDSYDTNSYSSGIMASISEVLTLVALLLVSVLVTWTIISSSVDISSTGRAAEGQYSGFWLPFRTALSVLFLIPMAGGYAIIQIIVLSVASWGMQSGDAVWQASLDHLVKTPQIEQVIETGAPTNNVLGGSFLRVKPTLPLEDLFNTAVCYEFVKTLDEKGLLQKETYSSFNGIDIEKHQPYMGGSSSRETTGAITSKIEYEWGTSKHKDLCGKITSRVLIPYPTPSRDVNYTEAEYLSWQKTSFDAFQQFYDESGFVIAAKNAQLFFSDEGGITKEQFLDSFSVTDLALAYKKYQETIVIASVNLISKNQKNNQFIETAKQSGWLYAGGFYWGIKSINDETQRLLEQSNLEFTKKVAGLDDTECNILNLFSWDSPVCSSPWQDYLHLANNYPAKALEKMYLSTDFFNKNILRVIEKERFDKEDWRASVDELDRGVGNADDDKSFVNKILEYIGDIGGYADGGEGNIITKAMVSSQDPISEIQSTGHWLIVGTTTAYFAVAQLASIAKASKAAQVLGTSVGAPVAALIPHIDMTVSYVSSIFFFLFAIGILLAYYLPLIPLITWAGAVIGYIFFLFEAFVGSIFWAGAHAMPEGHGVSGQHAKQGYMLLLALVVRPALMIVGFIGGMVLSSVLINFVGELATPYFAQVDQGHTVTVIGWAAGVFVMGSLVLSIIRRSFNLSFELADRVVRWIGHSGEHLGEKGEEEELRHRFLGLSGKFGGSSGKPDMPELDSVKGGEPPKSDKGKKGGGKI